MSLEYFTVPESKEVLKTCDREARDDGTSSPGQQTVPATRHRKTDHTHRFVLTDKNTYVDSDHLPKWISVDLCLQPGGS